MISMIAAGLSPFTNTAKSALIFAVRVNLGVLSIIRMTLRTMSLSRVEHSRFAATYVLLVRYCIKMTRAHAASHGAQVIPFEAIGRTSSEEVMGGRVLVKEGKDAVTIGVETGVPKPTRRRLVNSQPEAGCGIARTSGIYSTRHQANSLVSTERAAITAPLHSILLDLVPS